MTRLLHDTTPAPFGPHAGAQAIAAPSYVPGLGTPGLPDGVQPPEQWWAELLGRLADDVGGWAKGPAITEGLVKAQLVDDPGAFRDTYAAHRAAINAYARHLSLERLAQSQPGRTALRGFDGGMTVGLAAGATLGAAIVWMLMR